jgi:hypothetical protein
MMLIRKIICALVLLTFAGAASGQNTNSQNTGTQDTSSQDASSQQSTPPPAAFGQEGSPVVVNDNPPISGLDQPSLEPSIRPRSMLLGGVEGSESGDTNIGSDARPAFHSVTRGLGGLTMQRLWNRYQLAAAYVGGVGYYNVSSLGIQQIHELQAQQSVLWKTGQFSVRDSFSYLPEGTFGYGSYGGAGGFQLGLGGIGEGMGMIGSGFGGHYGNLGSDQFGSLGQSPHITNVAIADVVESLSPRSSVTAAGTYGLVHFTGNNDLNLIGSRQFGGQVGYDYALNPKDQIAVSAGYMSFQFPSIVGADNINSDVVQLLYGHRVSGRMDLIIAAGPQFTRIHDPLTGTTTSLTATGRFTLRYQLRKASLAGSYERFDTSGSGFFAGGQSDVATFTATRPLGRKYNAEATLGFARTRRLQSVSVGVNANSFDYGFAGFAVRRQFNYNWGAFLAYQWNDQILDSSFCTPGVPCNRISVRHVLTIGVDWHFRPIRLD